MQLRQEYSLCRVYKQSKCLRAFDRRPSAPVDPVAHQQEQLPGSVEATESSSARNSLGKERDIAGGSTGSGDDDGDLPIQMNWFYGMDQ